MKPPKQFTVTLYHIFVLLSNLCTLLNLNHIYISSQFNFRTTKSKNKHSCSCLIFNLSSSYTPLLISNHPDVDLIPTPTWPISYHHCDCHGINSTHVHLSRVIKGTGSLHLNQSDKMFWVFAQCILPLPFSYIEDFQIMSYHQVKFASHRTLITMLISSSVWCGAGEHKKISWNLFIRAHHNIKTTSESKEY